MLTKFIGSTVLLSPVDVSKREAVLLIDKTHYGLPHSPPYPISLCLSLSFFISLSPLSVIFALSLSISLSLSLYPSLLSLSLSLEAHSVPHNTRCNAGLLSSLPLLDETSKLPDPVWLVSCRVLIVSVVGGEVGDDVVSGGATLMLDVADI